MIKHKLTRIQHGPKDIFETRSVIARIGNNHGKTLSLVRRHVKQHGATRARETRRPLQRAGDSGAPLASR